MVRFSRLAAGDYFMQLPPHFALMFPVEGFGDGADVGFFDWVAAFDGVG